jgi:hydroxymethylglutaryl-CoA synthase
MPENGWGMAYLFSLAADPAGHAELKALCAGAGADFAAAVAEASDKPQVSAFGVRERISEQVFPQMNLVLRHFRKSAAYARQVVDKMTLGGNWMEELGNLYTGALPAWLAAGLEDAAINGVDLANREILLIGYGSGDAAEAIPITVVAGWEEAARKINMADAMKDSITLNEEQYTALRSGDELALPGYRPKAEFIVDRVGALAGEDFQDAGIEYYRFVN